MSEHLYFGVFWIWIDWRICSCILIRAIKMLRHAHRSWHALPFEITWIQNEARVQIHRFIHEFFFFRSLTSSQSRERSPLLYGAAALYTASGATMYSSNLMLYARNIRLKDNERYCTSNATLGELMFPTALVKWKVLTCLMCPQGQMGAPGLAGAAGAQGAPVSYRSSCTRRRTHQRKGLINI